MSQTTQSQSQAFHEVTMYSSSSCEAWAAPAPIPEESTLSTKGYFEWLKTKGVQEIIAGNPEEFKFTDNAAALNFAKLIPATIVDNNVLKLNLQTLGMLKQKYLVETSFVLNDTEKATRLRLISEAKNDVIKHASITPSTTLYQRGRIAPEVLDRIASVASLLNDKKVTLQLQQIEIEGWYSEHAVSAMDLMLKTYTATNYNFLSPLQRQKLEDTKKLILEVDKDGHFIGGLKADVNFTTYYTRQFPSSPQQRSALIAENVDLLLNGGLTEFIDYHTQGNKTTLKLTEKGLKVNPLSGYSKKGFLPTSSDTVDTLVLQAGGQSDHSSMRILKKEHQSDGQYRYFYTKVDAGAGVEDYDATTKKGTGIYTTEIIAILPRDIETTIRELLIAEREILSYKRTEGGGNNQGEAKGNNDKWSEYNNTIKTLRGKKVRERSFVTPIQESGNCTVFSQALTIGALTGDLMLMNDMMSHFKQYDSQQSVINLLQKADTQRMSEDASKQHQAKVPTPVPIASNPGTNALLTPVTKSIMLEEADFETNVPYQVSTIGTLLYNMSQNSLISNMIAPEILEIPMITIDSYNNIDVATGQITSVLDGMTASPAKSITSIIQVQGNHFIAFICDGTKATIIDPIGNINMTSYNTEAAAITRSLKHKFGDALNIQINPQGTVFQSDSNSCGPACLLNIQNLLYERSSKIGEFGITEGSRDKPLLLPPGAELLRKSQLEFYKNVAPINILPHPYAPQRYQDARGGENPISWGNGPGPSLVRYKPQDRLHDIIVNNPEAQIPQNGNILVTQEIQAFIVGETRHQQLINTPPNMFTLDEAGKCWKVNQSAAKEINGDIFMYRLGSDGTPVGKDGLPASDHNPAIFDIIHYIEGVPTLEKSFIAPDVPTGSHPTVDPNTIAMVHNYHKEKAKHSYPPALEQNLHLLRQELLIQEVAGLHRENSLSIVPAAPPHASSI